jgi:hypothetical protein
MLVGLIAVPVFGKSLPPQPPKNPFEELRTEMLELDLPSLGPDHPPHGLWLIHYWREDYVLLLDVDGLAAALDAWKKRGPATTIYRFDNYDIADYSSIYYRDLVSLIQGADLQTQEKDFLELLLIYILSREGNWYNSDYELNYLAKRYLSRHPDSPYQWFLETYMIKDLPPLLWTVGITFSAQAFVPFGDLRKYFSESCGIGISVPVSYRNITLEPSISWTWGLIKTPFTYEGEGWADGDSGNGFTTMAMDLSIGYRFIVTPNFAVLPQGGLGVLNIWESHPDQEGELGFRPVTSLGMLFEFFYREPGKTDGQENSWVLGLAYRSLANPWEDRFKGSALVLWGSIRILESF